ncbi:Elongation of very long chain fatty acids protein 7 [Harpegnathos saltator]|uniref:Elongation of very long chain fatty acids protein n=1 Tax=Harpegnathos saltator TaxID=610380 RepID=E2C991_HARSA|nr:Elongation of very long chain fatty acids protein 7 [Harpegnathos saltator]
MSNPFGVTLISLAYLSFVLYLGPLYMKKRKPYALTKIMICYNISVATASAVIFYGILTSGYTTHLSVGCEPFVISDDPMSISMARWVWWVLILKITELGDTVIFVLRKKYNQTSFLHVYHHTATLLLAWISCKYAPGGMWTFIMLPNCAVHVIMYMYYLCACLGPKVQKMIIPWKKYMTSLQLVRKYPEKLSPPRRRTGKRGNALIGKGVRMKNSVFRVTCSYTRTSLWLQRFHNSITGFSRGIEKLRKRCLQNHTCSRRIPIRFAFERNGAGNGETTGGRRLAVPFLIK